MSLSSPLVHRNVSCLPKLYSPRQWRSAFVLLLTAILLTNSLDLAAAQTFDLRPDRPQHPKIHFRLFDLLTLESTPAPQKEGPIRFDENGRVQVYIRAKPATPELFEQIENLGGKIDTQGLGVIQAWIPTNALKSLADLPEVQYIQPPDYGHTNVGSVTTEGDALLNVNTTRQQFGLTGKGIRIGVISDGLKGLEASIDSGDLPQTTFHCRYLTTIILRTNGCLAGETLVETSGGVTGKSFRSDQDVAAEAEGTAMLEIIHDLAPGAELWFANSKTGLEVLEAAAFLTTNADVVVSDFVLSHFFPDGQNAFSQAIAQIIDNSNNRSRAFFQSVGNQAEQHYSDFYTDSGLGNTHGNWHLFSSNSATTGPSTSRNSNMITLPPLGEVEIFLSWNDPAISSTNNYDLFLTDCAVSTLLDSSIEVQNGNQLPSEMIFYTNPSLTTIEACYWILKGHQAAPRMLNVILNSPALGFSHQFNTLSHSLEAPSDALGNLIAVGAVPASSPNQIESFSSQGPTFDGRLKPDLVATDGVAVTGAGGFPTPFLGTSASAPHAAAIAALLLEANPSLTFDQIRNALTSTAIDLGVAGPDTVFGHGRIDALAAVTSLVGMQPKTLTVTKGGTGTGTVTSSPAGIACGGDCTEAYADGTVVTLTAAAGTGSTFAGWSGGSCSGTSTCSVSMTAARTVTATFTQHIQNQAPSVNAGPSQTITLPNTATLTGTVSDDGLPNPPGVVTILWSKVSGPGTVTFGNPNAGDTTAVFSSGGTYVLRLTATDGALSNSSDLTITVKSQGTLGSTSSDINGDGKADIVWRNTNGVVAIWLMDGTAIAASGFPAGVPLAWQIAGVGDVNGDGRADVIWHNTINGTVAVWVMNGMSITSVGFPGSASTDWAIEQIGDVNGDGKADLLWRNTNSGVVAIWLMNGTSIGSAGFLGGVPAQWKIKGLGDVNGDGKADVVWQHSVSGTVALWLMNGSTIASVGFPGSTSLDWDIKGVGDVNGDGRADLIWKNAVSHMLAVWLMNGPVPSSTGLVGTPAPQWNIQQIGDVNGNGKADVILRNQSTGTVEVWLMNGLSVTTTGSPGFASTDWEIQ